MNLSTKLSNLGFSEKLQEYLVNYNQQHNCNYIAGRVAVEHKELYKVMTVDGMITAIVSGKFRHQYNDTDHYPAVGDWVILQQTGYKDSNVIIKEIMPRTSKFSRKVAGNRFLEQIIATNIDYLFICISLNKDFNLRRLERYLTMVWNSGAVPVVVLTKSDLCEDSESKVIAVKSVAFGIEVHAVSSLTGEGISNLKGYLKQGVTVAFIGSSGVGKSTLINHFAGEELLNTNEIRESDDKGRHTTTYRELIVLKENGIVIDTPGMREFHILDANDGVGNTFSDIDELAKLCKFSDCKHKTEPHCAVKEAIERGELTQMRLENYFRLQKEAAYMARKMRIKEIRFNKNNSKNS